MTAKGWVGLVLLALVSMYFVPQVWYVIIALMLGLFVFILLMVGALFVSKALGITALEIWVAQKILRKKKV